MVQEATLGANVRVWQLLVRRKGQKAAVLGRDTLAADSFSPASAPPVVNRLATGSPPQDALDCTFVRLG